MSDSLKDGRSMNKRLVGGLSVVIALVAPALVFAQVARFTQNEPLTVARMDQLVNAINAINFATPVPLDPVVGSDTGGPVTSTFTAQSPGMLLLVPGGGGFGAISASVSATTSTGASTIARSTDGSSMSVPIGAGQSLTLSFTNDAGDTPRINTFFSSLTGGAPPTQN